MDLPLPRADLARLGLLAPFGGAVIGLVIGAFRLTLDAGDHLRGQMLADASTRGVAGSVGVVVLAGMMVALAAFAVRRFCPEAAGSGIPRVQKVLAGELHPAPPRMGLVKFIAGTLAIAPGLALGREGPSVQIGAGLAYQIGRWFGLGPDAARALLAAGAGAGFAAAFGAPLAGALFVLEALLKRFEPVAALATLGASAVAAGVVALVCGDAPAVIVPPLPAPGAGMTVLAAGLGLLAGLAGVAYNRSLLAGLSLAGRLPVPPVLRAGVIGAAVGAVALVAPHLVGAGAGLTQAAVDGTTGLAALPLLILLRLALIVVSVAAGTPGGLLVPLLALGADLGLLFGLLAGLALPAAGAEAQGLALIGMAALFTAVVRTPLTAVILLVEISANSTLLLPMALASFAAMLVPTLLRDTPILDALRDRKP